MFVNKNKNNGEDLIRWKKIANIPLIYNPNLSQPLAPLMEQELIITKPIHFFEVFFAHWNHKTIKFREECMILFMTERNQVLGISLEVIGEYDNNIIEFSRIINRAERVRACKIAMAHNHPIPHLKPSRSDIRCIQELKKYLYKYSTIELYENIILSSSWKYFSFMKAKLL